MGCPSRYPTPPQQNSLPRDPNEVDLEMQHQQLISSILEEEEQVIVAHRQHIDHVMELMKLEMKELNDVDQPGSSIDSYVSNVDALLLRSMERIHGLRQQFLRFREHLQEEEILSSSMAAPRS